MTLEQMREFIVLAEELNYLAAADIMYTTQATLSRHIMAMETELGFPLFTRSTKRIELTQEGALFLLYARRAARIQDEFTAKLENARRSISGSLKLGYNAVSTFYGFTELLTQFTAEHPQASLTITQSDVEPLIRAVKDGEIDVAFIQDDPFHPADGLERIELGSDTLVAVLPSAHPLAGRKSIRLHELSGEAFVVAQADRAPGSVFLDACRHAGFEPRLARSGVIGPAVFGWVGSGSCVALEWKVPGTIHQRASATTVIVDVEPEIRSHICLLYRAAHLNAAGRTLVRFFCEYGERNQEAGK